MNGRGPEPFDLVIGGGGFIGLGLAAALNQAAPQGLRVAVVDGVDPKSEASPDPRASAISAASRRLLETVGVWGRVADEAQPIAEIDITDSRLEAAIRPLLLHFDTGIGAGEVAAHMVENAKLLSALRDHVGTLKNVVLMAPDRITGFQAGVDAVKVELESGTILETPLLVAADGRRSALRAMAGIKTTGCSYNQIGIAATVAHEKPHGGRAVQHFLPAGPFAILPLKGNRSSLVWSEERERGRAIMEAGDEEFLGEVRRRFGGRYGEVELAGPRGGFPLEMHIARAFVADRAALIGDAAHGFHPLAGQGLNIGLRDVAALGEVIVESARLGLDIGAPGALERYQRWRRFDSAVSISVMDGLNRLFSNESDGLRTIRSLGLGVVDRVPALKRFFVEEAAGLTGETPRLLKGEPI